MTAIAQAVRAALLDFVWQGLLVAFLLWIALFILRNRSARARYAASCAALMLMALLPVITACIAYTAPVNPSVAVSRAAVSVPATVHRIASLDWTGWLDRWALPLWSIGVLFFSFRLVWAAWQISALRRQSQQPGEALLETIAKLLSRLKLLRPVRVLITASADCPSVVGWIRPVVLLPAATIAGLTPSQLEAVLAHELAHVLRYDYMVNMLQAVVETFLFYHPAVWWASARIRHERELCCDDLAIAACGDALCYARALTCLERLRITASQLALGSAGGSLMYRIRRITGEVRDGHAPSRVPAVLALSLGLVCLGLNMPWARGQQSNAPSPDEPGVNVDLGGAAVLHRDAVEYPAPALEKHVQGKVVLEVTMDASGVVSDARVLSGPSELRKAALRSVLDWHFAKNAAGSTRQVSIDFKTPPEPRLEKQFRTQRAHLAEDRVRDLAQLAVEQELAAKLQREAQEAQALQSGEQLTEARRLSDYLRQLQAARESALAEQNQGNQLQWSEQAEALDRQLQILRKETAVLEGKGAQFEEAQRAQMAAMEERLAAMQTGVRGLHGLSFKGRRLKNISVLGLNASQRDELLARLPVHVGDTLAGDSTEKVEAAIKEFDEHLGLSMYSTADGQAEIHITAPGSEDAFELRP